MSDIIFHIVKSNGLSIYNLHDFQGDHNVKKKEGLIYQGIKSYIGLVSELYYTEVGKGVISVLNYFYRHGLNKVALKLIINNYVVSPKVIDEYFEELYKDEAIYWMQQFIPLSAVNKLSVNTNQSHDSVYFYYDRIIIYVFSSHSCKIELQFLA